MTTELGATGIKALKAERQARKNAETQVRELRAALRRAVDEADALADHLGAELDRIGR